LYLDLLAGSSFKAGAETFLVLLVPGVSGYQIKIAGYEICRAASCRVRAGFQWVLP